MCQVGYIDIILPKITMEDYLFYLEQVLRDLYAQYLKYPVGTHTRYEVNLGEVSDRDPYLSVDEIDHRTSAIKQLKEEGVISDYTIEDQQVEVYTFRIAKCLIDKDKLKEHIKLLEQSRSDIPTDQKIDAEKVGIKERLITKDTRGDFFYDGKHIEMNKDSIYYQLLDILFSHTDQQGFVSYEDIEKYLVQYSNPETTTSEERNKRISNALSNQLFRFAKINGKPLQNKTLNGKELVEVIRGKGLKLNNQPI